MNGMSRLEIDAERLFLIGPLAGFDAEIARLVSMLNYSRWTTLEAVDGLSAGDLDHLHDEKSNSIGALLLHIAAVEFSYQVGTFEGRGLNRRETAEWQAALELGERGRREIRGRRLEEYLQILEGVRARTLAELGGRKDPWLFEEQPFWSGKPANHYFMWFHVFEDELNHRGQIRWLRRRLPRFGKDRAGESRD
jgi:uncharacterized damage-inducible protein DinB